MLATADKVGGTIAVFDFCHNGFAMASIRLRLKVRIKRENSRFDGNLSAI